MHTIRVAIMMMINLIKIETIVFNTNVLDPLAITQPLSRFKFSSLTHPKINLVPPGGGLNHLEFVRLSLMSKSSKKDILKKRASQC